MVNEIYLLVRSGYDRGATQTNGDSRDEQRSPQKNFLDHFLTPSDFLAFSNNCLASFWKNCLIWLK